MRIPSNHQVRCSGRVVFFGHCGGTVKGAGIPTPHGRQKSAPPSAKIFIYYFPPWPPQSAKFFDVLRKI